MKDLLKISFVIVAVGLVLAVSGLIPQPPNYTAMAVGVAFVGLGVTIIMGTETKVKKDVYIIFWIVLLIIIAVLIGYQGELPTISIGG
jgi:NAD/NADP transhydrogenase beta subunit